MSIIEYLRADLGRILKTENSRIEIPSMWHIGIHLIHPRFTPVVICRLSRWFYLNNCNLVARSLSSLNYILFGLEVSLRCDIGPGLCLPHTIGTVIGAEKVGRNATIYHQVTLGAKSMDLGYNPETRPIIGNNVIIGSGAKVLGRVQIGDDVTVGANAVVTRSWPGHCRLIGIPARPSLKSSKGDYKQRNTDE
jgi:serine O-acetyltransferase